MGLLRPKPMPACEQTGGMEKPGRLDKLLRATGIQEIGGAG